MNVLRAVLHELRLFFTRPSWLSEVASGAVTFGWGVLALYATPRHVEWPSIDLMLQASDSSIWGVLGIVLGVGQMGVFRAIDRSWRKPWLRWSGAILVAWIWLAITISASRFGPWSPGIAAYAGWWGINVYLIFRIFWTSV